MGLSLPAISRLFRQQTVGLDIAEDAVRLVELSQSKGGGGLVVTWAGSEPYPAPASSDESISSTPALDPAEIALRKLALRFRGKGKSAISALATGDVIVKTITLPADLPEDAIEEQLRLEGQQYIPYTLDQVAFDFMVIGRDPEQAGRQRVLLIVSKKEVVDNRVALIESAGFKARSLEVRQFALWNLYSYLRPEIASGGGVVALVEVWPEKLYVHIFDNGLPVLSRDFFLSAEEAPLDLDLSLDLPSASPADKPKPKPWIKQGKELGRVLDLLQDSVQGKKIQQVALFGSGVDLPGIAEQVTGFSAEVLDPFQRMTFGAGVDADLVRKDASGYAAACGLALRGVYA